MASNWSGSGEAALSGGASGAAIGTSVMPGWGTLVGGILGAGLGIANNYFSNESTSDELEEYEKKLKQQYTQGLLTLNEYQTAINDAQSAYKEALEKADFESAGTIDFDKDSYNRDDYRKSNEASIIEGTKNSMRGENMGQGSSWGSGATGNILNAVVEQQEKLDEYADTQMNNQRDFDYKLASDEASNRLTALKSRLDALGTATSLDTDNITNYYNGVLGLQNTANANSNALTTAGMTANQQTAQNNASILNSGLQSLASSYAKNNKTGSILG